MNRTSLGEIAADFPDDSQRGHRARRKRALFAGLATTIGILLMTGCADKTRTEASAPAPRPGNFPVVEPFALDQAGTTLTVTFELPEARDNGILRPVFVGFRAVDKKGKGPDEEMRAAQTVRDYLHEAPLPVRLRVWRIDGAQPQPVVLSDGHWDMQNKRARWEPNAEDVFTRHFAASTDNDPLIDSGHYDFDRVYYAHAFGRIIPPMPGRYRLEVENLESHPVLQEQKRQMPMLRYELLVSHYYHRGIE